MREVSKQGSWGTGNTILVGTNIMYIKLSDDKVEEGKIFDFIDMKCGQVFVGRLKVWIIGK